MNPELLKKQIERLRGIFALLLAVMLCIHHAAGVELPTWMLSAVSLGLLCTCVQWKMHTSLPLGLFLAWLFVCLILHPGDHFHENRLRFLALTVGLLTFSPLLSGSCLNRTRLFLLRCVIITMGVLVVLSSVIWLYSLAVSTEQQMMFYCYGFCGAFNLGFGLASSAALTGLVSLFVILSPFRKSYKIWGGMMLLISCICMTAGASRMVLVSFAVSAAIMCMLKIHALKTLLRNRKALAFGGLAILVFAVSLPFADKELTRKITFGNQYGQIYSRHTLWQSRLSEIASSPWTGVGYANEPVRFKDPVLHIGSEKNEPGSSWLSVASYSGLIGTALFLWYVATVVIALRRNRRRKDFALQLALFLFLCMFAITEGWMLYPGALMFPVFWLMCSLICSERWLPQEESYLSV